MPPGLDAAATPPCEQDGQIVVRLGHAVFDGTAVHDHRIVQQTATIGLPGVLKLFQPSSEQLHVEDVDLGDLLLLVLLALVMRQVVMPLLHPDDRIRAIAAIVGHDEGANASAIGAERQRHDVKHQLHMVLELRRNPFRASVVGQLDPNLVGHGDAALHVAHRAHVFVELVLIVATQLTMESLGILHHEIENTGTPRLPPSTHLGGFARISLSEQPIEGQLRIHLRGHRCRSRTPRNVERVGAAVSGVALAGKLAAISSQFETRKTRVIADLLGRPLIHRNTHPNISSLSLAGLTRGQKGRRSPGMIAGTVAIGASLVVSQTAQHRYLVANRSQRLENTGQLEGRTGFFGRPVLHEGPIRNVHEGHSQRGLARRRRSR